MNQTKIIAVVLYSIFLISFAYIMNRSILELQSKTDELIKENDSLKLELQTSNSIIGRYEIGVYEFAEKNPESCKEFINIIENETE